MAMVPSSPSGNDDGRGWSGKGVNEDNVVPEGMPIGSDGNPTVCLFKGLADALAGGVMGSVFGFGPGLFKKQGFKGALREGASSAKTFALLSGVHSLVSCYLKRVRGKDDAWNAGIAGCATGLALSTPGSPQALAQSCISLGAFSFIMEKMSHPRTAIAATSSSTSNSGPSFNTHVHWHFPLPVLPPFTLPPLSFSSRFTFQKPHSSACLPKGQQQLCDEGAPPV